MRSNYVTGTSSGAQGQQLPGQACNLGRQVQCLADVFLRRGERNELIARSGKLLADMLHCRIGGFDKYVECNDEIDLTRRNGTNCPPPVLKDVS